MSNGEWKFPVVLDATMMKAYKSCPRKFWHEFVEGKKLEGENINVDLLAGKAMATGLEVARKAYFEDDEIDGVAIEMGLEAMLECYGPDRPEEVKNHKRLMEAFRAYFEKWRLSGSFGIVPIESGVENTFNFPVSGLLHPDTGETLLYAGKRDMIGREMGVDDPFSDSTVGELWGVDEKTCAYINDGWQEDYFLDWQFLGYTYFERIVQGHDIQGVIIRRIGLKRKIFDPRSDLKDAKIRYPNELLEDWFTEMKKTAEEIVDNYKAAFAPQTFGNACNEYRGCDYKPLCRHAGVVPEYQIMRWNPLTREEEK